MKTQLLAIATLAFMGCASETTNITVEPDHGTYLLSTESGADVYVTMDQESQYFKFVSVLGDEVVGVEADLHGLREWTNTDEVRIDWSDETSVQYYANGTLMEPETLQREASTLYGNQQGEEMMNAIYALADDGSLPRGCGAWAGVAGLTAKYKCMWGGWGNFVCVSATGITIACVLWTIGCGIAGC